MGANSGGGNVGVAVGERERAQPLRMAGGEDLANGAASVVAHQVDLVQAERGTQLLDHLGHRGHRLVIARRRAAVAGQVDRHAATGVLQGLDDVPPQHAACAGAVHEQGRGPGADLGVGDVSGTAGQQAAMRCERADIHISLPPLADRLSVY